MYLLENNSSDKFKSIYERELTEDNKVAKDLVFNYQKLIEQNSQQLFTLRFMLENMDLYRKTNFFY